MDQNINLILEDCKERMFAMDSPMLEVVLGLYGSDLLLNVFWLACASKLPSR